MQQAYLKCLVLRNLLLEGFKERPTLKQVMAIEGFAEKSGS
jgi:hypothetical protein